MSSAFPVTTAPVLHVVLRTTPSENRKNRPDWYSKERCIASIFAAVERAREAGIVVRVSVAVDVSSKRRLPGAIPVLLQRADAVFVIRGGTAATSWRPVVRVTRSRIRPADHDLIYFVEDDHLHQADALRLLVDGEADYRLLYAVASEHGTISDPSNGWADVPGGTSSFAVTGRAFREDAARHLAMSWGGGAWDELSWRALGSHATPPDLRYVLAPFLHPTQWPRRWGLRPIRHAAFRFLSLLLARGRRRSIQLRMPLQATHCEEGMLGGDADWRALALSFDGELDEIRRSPVTEAAAVRMLPGTPADDVRSLEALLP